MRGETGHSQKDNIICSPQYDNFYVKHKIIVTDNQVYTYILINELYNQD